MAQKKKNTVPVVPVGELPAVPAPVVGEQAAVPAPVVGEQAAVPAPAPEKAPEKKKPIAVLYRSKYKRHGVIMEAGAMVEMSDGRRRSIQRKHITFSDGCLSVSNEKIQNFLDNLISSGNTDIWRELTFEEKLAVRKLNAIKELEAIEELEKGS